MWYARRLLSIENLRPKSITVELGKEGIYFTPYSKILLQTDSLKTGLGNGFIKTVYVDNGKIAGLVLSNPVSFSESGKLGLVVNHIKDDGAVPVPVVISGKPNSKTFEVNVENEIPENGISYDDTYAWGNLDAENQFTKITSPYLITSIKPTEKGCTLELVDYNENIYETGIIPEYISNISEKPKNIKGEVVYETAAEIKEAAINFTKKVIEGTANVGNPDTPTMKATAEEDRIKLVCSCSGEGLKNNINKIEWRYIKNFDSSKTYNDSDWNNLENTSVLETEYLFNRSVDGYPEAEDFSDWVFSARISNIYNSSSQWSEPCKVNVENYGTWKIQKPEILTRVSDRTITLLINQGIRADNKKVYGTIKNRISISKPRQEIINKDGSKVLTDFDNGVYFCPATISNPYENKNNYKNISAEKDFIISENVYSQTMSLIGQSTNNIQNTLYSFRIVSFNEACESEPVEITETALCTSIRDIVKANETAKNAYISNLSAINANLGVISQGSLSGNDKNYWSLSTTTDSENQYYYHEGAFRVGGKNQYIKVIPIDKDGNDINYKEQNQKEISDYRLDFRAGTFSVSSTTTSFQNNFAIYDDNDPTKRLFLTPDGLFAQRNENATCNEDWENAASGTIENVAKVSIDGYGNVIISNSNDTVGMATPIPDTYTLYPLIDNITDLNSGNAENLELDSENLDLTEITPLKNYDGSELKGAYNGVIKCSTDKNILFLNDSSVNFFENKKIDLNSDAVIESWESNKSTDWGLTEEQVENLGIDLVFKE